MVKARKMTPVINDIQMVKMFIILWMSKLHVCAYLVMPRALLGLAFFQFNKLKAIY
jgi:hypothetical protein